MTTTKDAEIRLRSVERLLLSECSGTEAAQWNAAQKAYWDAIAADYDSFYQTAWSLAENASLARRFTWLADLVAPKVLDLGCGTGLGFELCTMLNPAARYFGVDISSQMLVRLRARHPRAHALVGGMDSLGGIAPCSHDVVIAIFSALSYAPDPAATVRDAFRIVKPGGRVFLSFLNRSSFRRFATGRRGVIETYATRRSAPRHINLVPAWTFTAEESRRLLGAAGFRDVTLSGSGFLAGVLECRAAWQLSEYLTRLFPRWCHTLEVQGVRPLGSSLEGGSD